jgi:hypothetical protein
VCRHELSSPRLTAVVQTIFFGRKMSYELMLRSQRLMIALDAFFVPEAQQTLARGGAIAEPPET